MVKVLFIDTGVIVKSVANLFSSILVTFSPGRVIGDSSNPYHASYTLKAFYDEYGLKNVEAVVCGFSLYINEHVYEHCYNVSKQNNIKYINISYGPSYEPIKKEAEIIKKWHEDGATVVFSNGNQIEIDPDTLYPNRICSMYSNCHIAAAEELVKKGFKISKKAVIIKSKTCIDGQCSYGSSFAAPRLLARIIKGEVQK